MFLFWREGTVRVLPCVSVLELVFGGEQEREVYGRRKRWVGIGFNPKIARTGGEGGNWEIGKCSPNIAKYFAIEKAQRDRNR